MFPKDILQIIGIYSNTDDFIKLYELYDISIDVYLKYTKIPYLIHSNHKCMDHLIQKNILSDENVCEYALKYDIPKYIRLHNLYAQYKTYKDYDVCLTKIPKIVKYNYTQHGFRFHRNIIDKIFEENAIELMQIIQDYPQKSSICLRNVFDSCSYFNYNNLWKLNYKHKLAYLLIKHPRWNIPLSLLCCFGGFRILYDGTGLPICFFVSSMCSYIFVSAVKEYVMNKFDLLYLPL